MDGRNKQTWLGAVLIVVALIAGFEGVGARPVQAKNPNISRKA